VDDEPLARRRLRSLLAADSEVQLVAECSEGSSAVEAIREFKPDLVFLDVQMPEVDGFEVLRRIAPQYAPLVVFVTAFDEYAVRAFDAHAFDYLLKPFKRSRFYEALHRAKQQLTMQDATQPDRLAGLLNQVDVSHERIAIRSGGRIVILRTEEIDWIRADLNYVQVRSNERDYTVRDSISSFEKKLTAGRFIRIHRSIIVNADRIRELEPCNGSEYMVILRDGKELPLGRNYRHSVEAFLHISN
jgi:two-component system LytT family response regulator